MQGPVNLLPGQVLPDEAQCHQIVGTCFRSVPGHEGECDKLYCTRHLDSSILTTVNELRLDGSYCGQGKVCNGGQCSRVDSSRSNQMFPVNGGWSLWRPSQEEECGGGTCSECEIGGQVSLKVDVRRCDNPYPNNGGSPCLGTQVRGHVCTDSTPLSCRSRGYRYDTRMKYMETVCKREYAGGLSIGLKYDQSNANCEFTCYVKNTNEQRPKRFPDGVSCGSQATPGRCVSGICMFPKCRSNPNLFVSGESDCDN